MVTTERSCRPIPLFKLYSASLQNGPETYRAVRPFCASILLPARSRMIPRDRGASRNRPESRRKPLPQIPKDHLKIPRDRHTQQTRKGALREVYASLCLLCRGENSSRQIQSHCQKSATPSLHHRRPHTSPKAKSLSLAASRDQECDTGLPRKSAETASWKGSSKPAANRKGECLANRLLATQLSRRDLPHAPRESHSPRQRYH